MKILDAWVDDPADRGYDNGPNLVVVVDEEPSPTSQRIEHDIESRRRTWNVQKYGPFIRFDVRAHLHRDRPKHGGSWSSRDSCFNQEFVGNGYPAVVDVTIEVRDPKQPVFSETRGSNRGRLLGGYSLPIDRAKRLLKRYSPQWRLSLNEILAANTGELAWQLERVDPICSHSEGNPMQPQRCKKAATHHVTMSEGRLIKPLCETHKADRDRLQAQRRIHHSS